MKYVCTGAILRCSMGTATCKLRATPKRVTLMGEDQANVNDFVSKVNVPGFGLCRSLKYPPTASATAAHHGRLTPMPCVPGTCPKWKVIDKYSLICGEPALLQPSTLRCVYGGTISIVAPGQQKEIKVMAAALAAEEVIQEIDQLSDEELTEQMQQDSEQLVKEPLDKQGVVEGIHTVLDLAGFVPGLGAIPDILNAAIYAAEGNFGMAAFSVLAAVPGVGDAAAAGKIAYKGVKVAQKTGKVAQKTGKVAQKTGKVAQNVPSTGSLGKTTTTVPTGSLSKTTTTTPTGFAGKTTTAVPTGSLSKTTTTTPTGFVGKTTTTAPTGSLSKTTTTAPSGFAGKTTTTAPTGSLSKTTTAAPTGSAPVSKPGTMPGGQQVSSSGMSNSFTRRSSSEMPPKVNYTESTPTEVPSKHRFLEITVPSKYAAPSKHRLLELTVPRKYTAPSKHRLLEITVPSKHAAPSSSDVLFKPVIPDKPTPGNPFNPCIDYPEFKPDVKKSDLPQKTVNVPEGPNHKEIREGESIIEIPQGPEHKLNILDGDYYIKNKEIPPTETQLPKPNKEDLGKIKHESSRINPDSKSNSQVISDSVDGINPIEPTKGTNNDLRNPPKNETGSGSSKKDNQKKSKKTEPLFEGFNKGDLPPGVGEQFISNA